MTPATPADASPFGVELEIKALFPSIPLVLSEDERPHTLSHTLWDACSEEPS